MSLVAAIAKRSCIFCAIAILLTVGLACFIVWSMCLLAAWVAEVVAALSAALLLATVFFIVACLAGVRKTIQQLRA